MRKDRVVTIKSDIELAERLRRLRQQSGWKDILTYLEDKYTTALSSLINREEPGARLTAKIIGDMLEWMTDNEINGEELLKRHKAQLFGKKQEGETE